MINILRKPNIQSIIRKLFYFVVIASLITAIIPFSISPPSLIFQEIGYLKEEISEIAFYESDEDSRYMRYSAQYWLAPALVIHNDITCCQYLITNDLDIVSDYMSVTEFSEGWFLVEIEQ